jgi:hypothetical protein
MHIRVFLREFAIIFLIALAATLVVTYLWNLIFDGKGIIDWGTSFRFSIVLGIIFGIIEARKK